MSIIYNEKTIIEDGITQANKLSNIEGSINEAQKLSTQTILSKTSKVGIKAGDSAAGFESQTSNADDVVDGLEESEVDQVSNVVAVAQMTQKVPGVQTDLVKTVPSSDRTKLNSITGDTAGNKDGFLNVSVCLAQPAPMLATVKQAVPTVSSSNLKEIAKETVDIEKPLVGQTSKATGSIDDFEEFAKDALEAALNAVVGTISGSNLNTIAQGSSLIGIIFAGAEKVFGSLSLGFKSLIENVSEQGLSRGKTVLSQLAVKNGIQRRIKSSDEKKIYEFMAKEEYSKATAIVRKYSDKSDEEIVNKLRSIDNRASVASAIPTDGITINKNNHNTIRNVWNETNTPSSYFNTLPLFDKDEVQVEFSNVEREVTEIIISSTATTNDIRANAQNLFDAMVKDLERAPNSHYLITRSGLIQRIRPIDVEIINHPGIFLNNHHTRSVQVTMVGGINALKGVANPEDFFSAESYTSEQWKALDQFLTGAFNALPGIQVIEVSDVVSSGKGGPHFDVAQHIKSKYGKDTLFTDLETQEPFTREELAKNIRKGKI